MQSLDGPYLIYDGDALVARWVNAGTGEAGMVPFGAPLPHFPTFRAESVQTGNRFPFQEEVEFEGVSRVAALSDIHGQYDMARKLLESNGIVDSLGDWTYGDGHLVIVGDVFDRGDQVNEALWFIHYLQQQAAAAGGRLHFLLGNHETLVMDGEETYINDRYRKAMGLLGRSYRELYGPDTYLGRWLRSLPLAVKINGDVFVHGGISKPMIRTVGSLRKMNKLYHNFLMDANDVMALRESNFALDMLHGRQGPLWYRGYFSKNNFPEEDIDYVLRKLDAKTMIVGHTSFESIKSFYHGKIYAIDSSIKFGSMGELLLIEDGEYRRGTVYGTALALAK